MFKNQKVRITKIYELEVAHALFNYDGACKNIHGHSYKLEVTLLGVPNSRPSDSKDGLIIDFKELKKIIIDEINTPFDHAVVLNNLDNRPWVESLKTSNQKLVITDFQPTCENLCVHFASLINKRLPQQVILSSVKLYETSTSFAEWYATDN